MAENESLDLQKDSRWHDVCRGVQDNEKPEKIAADAIEALRKKWNSLVLVIPFERMLCCSNPGELSKLVRDCTKSHHFAQLFAERVTQGGDRSEIFEGFLSDICERFLDQTVPYAFPSANFPSVQVVQKLIDAVRDELAPKVCRLSERLAKNPSKRLRAPSRKKIGSVSDVLNTSLLPPVLK